MLVLVEGLNSYPPQAIKHETKQICPVIPTWVMEKEKSLKPLPSSFKGEAEEGE